MLRHKKLGFSLAMALAMFIVVSGCGRTGAPANPKIQTASDDEGWWCVEHGVPESDCSMCSSKAAASFKSKGDWCKEHNRAESQCFICNPARAEKFAALYEAKFGKKPPIAEENRREP